MALLTALGLKAVGLRRRSLLVVFFHKLLSRSPSSTKGLLMLLVISFGLLWTGKVESEFSVKVQSIMSTITAPVVRLFDYPVLIMTDILCYFRCKETMQAEINLLKAQNARLLQSTQRLEAALSENNQLRQLVQAVSRQNFTLVSARIVGKAPHNFSGTFIIKATDGDGIKKNQAVINEDGVVGRVIYAGDDHSRLLPLTDLNSRIPVQIEGTEDHAILAGQNRADLKLTHFEKTIKVKEGDRLVTSGYGGIFPPGLPVAVVTHVEGESIKATPCAHLNKLDWVSIVQF
jgi:rod shape-determining protein MreC